MKRILWLCMVLATAGCGGGGSESGSATPPAAGAAGATAASALPADLDKGPRASESPVDAALAEQGEALFKTKACSACHAFGAKATGPDLAGVATRRTARWIESQILHPDLMVKSDPIARELFAKHALQMPDQGLSPEEARAVIEYFKHRDHEDGATH